jgi:trehalose 6-phosphate synthase
MSSSRRAGVRPPASPEPDSGAKPRARSQAADLQAPARPVRAKGAGPSPQRPGQLRPARLVVVSNRVADPRKTAAGGLAVALADVLKTTGGLWFGWSGHIAGQDAPAPAGHLHTSHAGPVSLVTTDLAQADYDAYYLGYANGVLWPVFHYRLDLADFDPACIHGFRRVNQRFAHELAALLKPDDIIWIHDYHLIPLASELRALGCRQRIGFFLHIPLPPPPVMAAIPGHDWLMRSLCACDVVGFQGREDLQHFCQYIQHEARAQDLGAGHWRVFNRTLLAAAFPIGIDVEEFQALGRGRDAVEMFNRMRHDYSQRKLLVGVDRLDYSKGLPHRLRAFRELLRKYPDTRKVATLVQIVSPSREDVSAYTQILHQLESLSGSINGNHGELDWMPVRYMHRTVARSRLPGLYRASRVALVTPLRDGMNLVAKEYIAAQDPEDPGVLVLSRFAGAADQLRDALLVNPYDPEGTADAIHAALEMPLAERRARHAALLANCREQDVHWWCDRFLSALRAAQPQESGTPWLRV